MRQQHVGKQRSSAARQGERRAVLLSAAATMLSALPLYIDSM